MPKDYIERTKELAVRVEKKYNIPAPVAIAVSALETGWGRYVKGNNYFGIKGSGQEFKTHEYVDGKRIKIVDGFRAYDSMEASFMDFGLFLNENPRYKKCFETETPHEFVIEMHQAGYATDPEYSNKLISIIDRYNLENITIKEERTMIDKVKTALQILPLIPGILDGVKKLSDKIKEFVEFAENEGPEHGGGEEKKKLVMGMVEIAYELIENMFPIPIKKEVLMNTAGKLVELWVLVKNAWGEFRK